MSRPSLALRAPVLLVKQHELTSFTSGEQALDDWLRQRALANLENGASRTYVVCLAGGNRVVGYYALAMGQVLNREVPGKVRRNMPAKIPTVMLARLAVDKTVQGHGLGGALLQDAVARSLRAAQMVAARLMIVHATSPAAEAFYLHHGFSHIGGDAPTPTLALDLAKVKAFSSS
jgi:GNAT superfamily N-acetyltransferase